MYLHEHYFMNKTLFQDSIGRDQVFTEKTFDITLIFPSANEINVFTTQQLCGTNNILEQIDTLIDTGFFGPDFRFELNESSDDMKSESSSDNYDEDISVCK
jgi:hypothetical protein